MAGIGFVLLTDDDGGDDEARPTEPAGTDRDIDAGEETEPTEPEEAFDPDRLTGTWEGTYECSDEVTGLTLTIDDYPGEDGVGAAFHLHPTDDHPDGPDVMFHMEGTYTGGMLTLEGSGWIDDEQPDEIDSWVDLEADLSNRTDTEVIEGDVTTDGCEGFSVERTDIRPWYHGTFQGEYHCAQGKTGMTITIEATEQDWMEAVFEFYAPDDGSNPTVPYGRFRATGWYQNRELRGTEAAWEERPEGYVTTDFVSWPEAQTNPNRLYGTLPDAVGCSLFTGERIDPEDAQDRDGTDEDESDPVN